MIHSIRFQEFDLIVHRAQGTVGIPDLQDAVVESHSGEVMSLEIWDFSNARASGLEMDDLGDLLAGLFEVVSPTEGEKTAFVTPGPAERQLALLFQRMAEFQQFTVELRTFRDLQSAVIWLFGSGWQHPLDAIASTPQEDETGLA